MSVVIISVKILAKLQGFIGGFALCEKDQYLSRSISHSASFFIGFVLPACWSSHIRDGEENSRSENILTGGGLESGYTVRKVFRFHRSRLIVFFLCLDRGEVLDVSLLKDSCWINILKRSSKTYDTRFASDRHAVRSPREIFSVWGSGYTRVYMQAEWFTLREWQSSWSRELRSVAYLYRAEELCSALVFGASYELLDIRWARNRSPESEICCWSFFRSSCLGVRRGRGSQIWISPWTRALNIPQGHKFEKSKNWTRALYRCASRKSSWSWLQQQGKKESFCISARRHASSRDGVKPISG